QKVAEILLPDAKVILQARIRRLTQDLAPRVKDKENKNVELLTHLTTELGCTVEDLALALLAKTTEGQAFTVDGVEREQPTIAPRSRDDRGDRGDRGSRPSREGGRDGGRDSGPRGSREPLALSEGKVRCRTALGTRDGVAARNLLGAILNEGGLQRDAIGRIQIRESFSLVELPEEGLERLLGKLKDTRVGGKALKLRRYRED
ncbi:MAG TPA: ATP-dependent RNA helicase, partial [Pseudomonas sp.]|nr:ATP-dependent RNA helicase [Pseudomonas sp.]